VGLGRVEDRLYIVLQPRPTVALADARHEKEGTENKSPRPGQSLGASDPAIPTVLQQPRAAQAESDCI
jgi:hypothetical protein